jgi:hypothetical protein
MTVKELIETLKSFPQDSEIIIESVDPTDYHYVIPIENIRFEDKFYGDGEEIGDNLETGEWIYPHNNVVIIKIDC